MPASPTSDEFQQYVRAALDAGYSVHQLAEASDTSCAIVERWADGRSRPHPTICKIAKGLIEAFREKFQPELPPSPSKELRAYVSLERSMKIWKKDEQYVESIRASMDDLWYALVQGERDWLNSRKTA